MSEKDNKDQDVKRQIDGEVGNIEDKQPEEEVEVDEIEALKNKIADLEDSRLRDLADFQNIKRRLEKEKAQSMAYAHEQFARDLLSVVDSLDNASAMVSGDIEVTKESFSKLKEGIELTINQFAKIFEKHGIELVSMENGFDPNFHEAVMKVDSPDHKEGEVVQVLQTGYKIRDRVLRPAMVSICK